eukprot:6557629-Prymnesium_polylepis.1
MNYHKLGGTMPNYRGEAVLNPETTNRGRDLHITSTVNWNTTEGSEPITQLAPGIGYREIPLSENTYLTDPILSITDTKEIPRLDTRIRRTYINDLTDPTLMFQQDMNRIA